jgi:hypothetical protein
MYVYQRSVFSKRTKKNLKNIELEIDWIKYILIENKFNWFRNLEFFLDIFHL